MSSERKTQSARANGAKSRGPKTAEGKAKSALNAVTHGLNSKTVVLGTESEDRFEEFRARYFADLAPRNQVEAGLVDQIVAASWRLERVWSMEASIIDVEIARQREQIERDFIHIDDEVRTAMAFKSLADESRALALLNRYEVRFERIIHRSLETLSRLRETEKQNLPNEPNPTSEPAAARAKTGTDSAVPSRLLARGQRCLSQVFAPPTTAEPPSPHAPQPTTHTPTPPLRLNGYRGARCLPMH